MTFIQEKEEVLRDLEILIIRQKEVEFNKVLIFVMKRKGLQHSRMHLIFECIYLHLIVQTYFSILASCF